MEPGKQPKRPDKKVGNVKTKELKTEPPISEKDEVKRAEDRTKNTRKRL